MIQQTGAMAFKPLKQQQQKQQQIVVVKKNIHTKGWRKNKIQNSVYWSFFVLGAIL